MDKYAAAWHIQWLKSPFSGKRPKSLTGYVQALNVWIENQEAQDDAYASLETAQYDGRITGIITQISMQNDNAMVSGVALKKLILDRLPHKILDQMPTINLTRRSNHVIIDVIIKAGQTAVNFSKEEKNLSLRKSVSE